MKCRTFYMFGDSNINTLNFRSSRSPFCVVFCSTIALFFPFLYVGQANEKLNGGYWKINECTPLQIRNVDRVMPVFLVIAAIRFFFFHDLKILFIIEPLLFSMHDCNDSVHQKVHDHVRLWSISPTNIPNASNDSCTIVSKFFSSCSSWGWISVCFIEMVGFNFLLVLSLVLSRPYHFGEFLYFLDNRNCFDFLPGDSVPYFFTSFENPPPNRIRYSRPKSRSEH